MLKELINQFFLENQKVREQLHFYITDAGKCPRSVFFKFMKAPNEGLDARILRVFEQGDLFHRHLFSVLYRIRGISVITEIQVPAQEIISGRADAIITCNGENYILDIKSMNSMIFKNLNAPKEENVYQIQLYLHFFRIQKGILLYIDKDRQDMKEFFIEYDKALCEKLLGGFYELKSKIETKTLPARLEDYPKNWQCQYCQYKEVCKNQNGATYELAEPAVVPIGTEKQIAGAKKVKRKGNS